MARGNRIALLISSLGKTQIDKFTPLDLADLDLRLNVTSRNWVDTVKTIEDIFDCIQEDVTGKEVTRILYRLPIEGEFIAYQVAPLAALAYGGAASPVSVTPASKVFTVTIDGDGGDYKLRLDYDEIDQTTVKIPFDASAALFKRIIEDLDNVGFGNTTVSKVGDVYTVTYTGKRAFANIPDFTVEDNTVTGAGTVTILQTTAGVQFAHNITEMSEYSQPLTTVGIAFEDEAGSERLMIGVSVENLVVTGATNNGKVTYTADLVARNLIIEPSLDVGECSNTGKPVRTADCLFTRNSVDYSDVLQDFSFNFSNNTLTGNTAYTGRGVKPSRFERASKRTRSLTYTLSGIANAVTNPLYAEAETNPEADIKRASSLRIGTAGENLTVNIPNGITELATGSGGLAFDNESEEAINRYVDTPAKAGSTKPTSIVANVNQSGTYLTPAS